MRLYLFIFIVSITMACSNPANNNKSVNSKPVNTVNNNTAANTTDTAKIPEYSYEIVKAYNHDPQAFTQGLVVYNDFFYEGTGGKNGDPFFSSIRKVDIETGKVLQKFDLSRDYFGEGITIFNDKLYEITWQEKTAFVYDVKDFKLLKELHYAGEGWGLTHDGTNLIMSDGTHVIRFLNPETFNTIRTISVFDEKGKPVLEINELEYIKGEIWANIWQKGEIIRIDPATGKIVGRIDFQKLMDDTMDKSPDADVLNGIAYDEKTDRIFITGKKWSKLYEVKIVPKG